MYVHVCDSALNHFSIKSLVNCMIKMAQTVVQKQYIDYTSKDIIFNTLEGLK